MRLEARHQPGERILPHRRGAEEHQRGDQQHRHERRRDRAAADDDPMPVLDRPVEDGAPGLRRLGADAGDDAAGQPEHRRRLFERRGPRCAAGCRSRAGAPLRWRTRRNRRDAPTPAGSRRPTARRRQTRRARRDASSSGQTSSSPQAVAQVVARAGQSRFHRPNRDTERRRDFVVAQSVDFPKNDHGALVERQRVERAPDPAAVSRCLQHAIGRRRPRGDSGNSPCAAVCSSSATCWTGDAAATTDAGSTPGSRRSGRSRSSAWSVRGSASASGTRAGRRPGRGRALPADRRADAGPAGRPSAGGRSQGACTRASSPAAHCWTSAQSALTASGHVSTRDGFTRVSAAMVAPPARSWVFRVRPQRRPAVPRRKMLLVKRVMAAAGAVLAFGALVAGGRGARRATRQPASVPPPAGDRRAGAGRRRHLCRHRGVQRRPRPPSRVDGRVLPARRSLSSTEPRGRSARELREANRLAPDAPEPLVALGDLFAARGEPAQAAAWYAQAADRLRDQDPALLYRLALARYQAGRPDGRGRAADAAGGPARHVRRSPLPAGPRVPRHRPESRHRHRGARTGRARVARAHAGAGRARGSLPRRRAGPWTKCASCTRSPKVTTRSRAALAIALAQSPRRPVRRRSAHVVRGPAPPRRRTRASRSPSPGSSSPAPSARRTARPSRARWSPSSEPWAARPGAAKDWRSTAARSTSPVISPAPNVSCARRWRPRRSSSTHFSSSRMPRPGCLTT